MTATRTAPPSSSAVEPQRRRGVALEDAILAAAWDELSEAGYTAFRVENVAARARTGKASIYRRWGSKQALVMDVLDSQLPTAKDCGLPMVFAEDTTTADALRTVASNIARVMLSPAGSVVRAIKCEALADPELAVMIDERFQAPRREALLALLRRGVDRGEVRPDAVSTVVADVVPAVLTYRLILQREPLTEADIATILEQVFLPLVAAR